MIMLVSDLVTGREGGMTDARDNQDNDNPKQHHLTVRWLTDIAIAF
jgi:hypothetical protein